MRCPDCGREVSDAAPACPGCGRPMQAGAAQMQMMQPQPAPAKRSSVFWGVLLALIVFFVVLPIGGVITCVVCAGAGSGIGGAKLRADIGTTNTACNSIRSATILYLNSHAGNVCPSVAQLKQDDLLVPNFRSTDPWGNAFKIVCGVDEITVSTPGPDQTWGTADDISVPSKAQAAALQAQIDDANAKLAKLQAQLASEKDPAEIAGLQAALDAEKARRAMLQQQVGTAAP
jgi:hypothetical protein